SGGYFFQGSSNTFTWPAAASVNVANGVSSEFRFPATGALSGLTKTGGGTFGFGASLVTNNAPININGGTLAYFRPGAAFNGFTGSNPVTIAAGATFNLGKALDVIGAISGGGTIVLGALNDSTSGVNGSSTSTVWGSTLNVNSDNSSSTFSGNIIDDGTPLPLAPLSGGHFVKAGNGTLTLSGSANTFRGVVLVQLGKLIAAAAGSIPDSAPVILTNASTLQLGVSEAIGSFGNAAA